MLNKCSKQILVGSSVVLFAAIGWADQLESGFASPPPDARPGALWYWRHELSTREGVTADLEAMARVGIGEMLIGFIGGHDVPLGDMPVISEKWWEIMRHTAKEANRLGVKLRFFNSPGWSSTGGPWITPEMSMQSLVWSETRHKGPGRMSRSLPHPPKADISSLWRFTKEYGESIKPFAYLGDVAVLAFPTPQAERLEGEHPTVTCVDPQFNFQTAGDGDKATVTKLSNPKPGEPVYLKFEYSAPFRARSVSVTPRHTALKRVLLESSEDGKTWALIGDWTPRHHPGDQAVERLFEAAPARLWRIGLVGAVPDFRIAEVALSPGARVEDWSARAMANDHGVSRPPFTDHEAKPGETIDVRTVIDLTDKLKRDGTLDWEAPSGDWTIMRFGRIPAMKANAPASLSGSGLECDKYNPAAVDLHWNSFVAPLLADKDINAAMTGVHIDSYEKGAQTWSPRVPQEFKDRAGYDLRPFLPALTGRVINDIRSTERFLWDYRKTLCDTMADNYYGRMAELARENGKVLSIEPYHQTQFDTDVVGMRGDAVMTEFHLGTMPSKAYFKNGSSPAHIAGIKRTEAEAFTSMPKFGGNWSTAPWDLKGLGDHAFCAGVNRFMFHVSNHQPWLNLTPGVQSPWGQHIERNNTWFDYSYGWLRYIARCQHLLQQGRYCGDFLVSVGENSPNQSGVKMEIPPGFEFDNISAEAILGRLKLKDGRLTTGGLGDYGPLLVLSPDEPYMTAAMARKLKSLVEDGMTLAGPRPRFSPTLDAQPKEDKELEALVAQLWGDTDGKTKTTHSLGKGQVIWGEGLARILDRQFGKPQFAGCDKAVQHIKRETDGAEIWFVANTGDKPVQGDCSFRTKAGAPEFWDPMTGRTRRAASWRQENGQAIIPMRFEQREGLFVVFSKSAAGPALQSAAAANFAEAQPLQEISGPWDVQFDPKWFYDQKSEVRSQESEAGKAKVIFEKLEDWTKRPEEAVRYFSGTAAYRKTFAWSGTSILPVSASAKRSTAKMAVPLFLELGEFKGIAEVHLNGKNLGPVWCAPWRIEITDAVKMGANELEIRMANCWPNRLIGDEQLPADAEFTSQGVGGGMLKSWPKWLSNPNNPSPDVQRPSGRRTFATYKHWTGNEPLLPSGLLGPVRVMTAE